MGMDANRSGFHPCVAPASGDKDSRHGPDAEARFDAREILQIRDGSIQRDQPFEHRVGGFHPARGPVDRREPSQNRRRFRLSQGGLQERLGLVPFVPGERLLPSCGVCANARAENVARVARRGRIREWYLDSAESTKVP